MENLTNELERLQSENDALKQQLTAGQALNGLDPFTKSVILDKVGGIVTNIVYGNKGIFGLYRYIR